ncbi:MAG: zinc-ribbon domain-containing protein [Clostridia bacterium]|nr:zinc-ribbon domain-containing protein [Clostridia bacterium]
MYCKYCGKIIDDYATVCSKCGQAVENPKVRPVAQAQMPYPPQTQADADQVSQAETIDTPAEETPVKKKKNGFGIAGFVFAILGIIFTVIFNLLAVIFSAIGVGKRRKYTSRNGLAVAGLVIGLVLLIVWVAVFVLAYVHGGFDSLSSVNSFSTFIDWIKDLFTTITEGAVAVPFI